MHRWSGLISSPSLFRQEYAWCPACFDELGEEARKPLLWSLEVVKVCPKHKVILQAHCPFLDCGKTQLSLSPYSLTGFCDHCHRWLGQARESVLDTGSDIELEKQLWIANEVGSLLSASAGLSTPPTKDTLCNKLDSFIDSEMDGTSSALARQLDIHHSTLYAIRHGDQLPQLGTLLKIAYALQQPLVDLILDNQQISMSSDRLKDASELDVPISRPQKGTTDFDKAKAGYELRKILDANENPPPSMREVAKRLGYDQSFLQKHFRDETSQISRRYQEFTEQEAQKRRQKIRERVRQAFLECHNKGIYPSMRQIQKWQAC